MSAKQLLSGALALSLMTAPLTPTTAHAHESASSESEQAIEFDLELSAQYQLALSFMIKQQYDTAATILDQIIRADPDSDHAQRSKELLTQIHELQAIPKSAPILSPAMDTSIPPSGRSKFIVSQTLAAINMGLAVPGLMGADSAEAYATASIIGAGAGLAFSTAFSKRRGISQVQAESVYLGQLWTSFNAQMLAIALFPDHYEEETFFGIQLATPVLGGLAGYGYNKSLELTSGQTSMAFSSGVWGAYFGLMGILTANEGDNPRSLALAPILAGDAALILASSLAQDLSISRSRVRLINLGGFLGALTAGAGLLIAQDALPNDIWPYTVTLGAAAGIGLAGGWFLSSDWDSRYHPEVMGDVGGTALLNFNGDNWGLGTPLPSVQTVTHKNIDGIVGYDTHFTMAIAQGTW